MTMLHIGDKLEELCRREKLRVRLVYVDLWETDSLPPQVDIVVEMFPFFSGLSIPIVDGRPLFTRQGERQFLPCLVTMIRDISKR